MIEQNLNNLDPVWSRSQFPALQRKVQNQPAIFFDGPGGTQVPQQVIEAISLYLSQSNANEGGPFVTSIETEQLIVDAHEAIADFLGCDAEEVVFGSNMTTLTFALARSLGREFQAGDEIIVTRLDHDANVAPWCALEEKGVVVRYVDIQVEDCTLDMTDLVQYLNERTRLVAVGYASNAVGTINDVEQIVKLAHDAGALVLIDAVHYAPHGPIDLRQLDCDFLVCSPYKFFGPHSGVLYGKREHLMRLQPYKLRPASNDLPYRWETGTQNHEGLAGVTAAIHYLCDLGHQVLRVPTESRRDALSAAMQAIQIYEKKLGEHLILGLLEIPGLTVYGIQDPVQFDHRTPTIAFRLKDRPPAAIAEILGQQGIFCWYGNYYALNLTERLDLESSGGMVRMGLVHYNTAQEVERVLNAVRAIAKQ
jgi:cysteine desulfurase family protein (TIGR01976 family)